MSSYFSLPFLSPKWTSCISRTSSPTCLVSGGSDQVLCRVLAALEKAVGSGTRPNFPLVQQPSTATWVDSPCGPIPTSPGATIQDPSYATELTAGCDGGNSCFYIKSTMSWRRKGQRKCSPLLQAVSAVSQVAALVVDIRGRLVF